MPCWCPGEGRGLGAPSESGGGRRNRVSVLAEGEGRREQENCLLGSMQHNMMECLPYLRHFAGRCGC